MPTLRSIISVIPTLTILLSSIHPATALPSSQQGQNLTTLTDTATNLTSLGKITCYGVDAQNPKITPAQSCIAAADWIITTTHKVWGQTQHFSNSAPETSPAHLPATFRRRDACSVVIDLQPDSATDDADWKEVHHAAFVVASYCWGASEYAESGGEVFLGAGGKIRVRVGDFGDVTKDAPAIVT